VYINFHRCQQKTIHIVCHEEICGMAALYFLGAGGSAVAREHWNLKAGGLGTYFSPFTARMFHGETEYLRFVDYGPHT
jgi:hypothetical protein